MPDTQSVRQPRKTEINATISQILLQNPQIIINQIELFTEVYYPIATLEIEMTETTFEDFEIVPMTVLKLVGANVHSAEDIAVLLGLKRNYVQKILDMLMGYGFINESGLTGAGLRSLNEERPIA